MNVDKILKDLIDDDITITISVRELAQIIDSLEKGKTELIKGQDYLGAAMIRQIQIELLERAGKTKKGLGI